MKFKILSLLEKNPNIKKENLKLIEVIKNEGLKSECKFREEDYEKPFDIVPIHSSLNQGNKLTISMLSVDQGQEDKGHFVKKLEKTKTRKKLSKDSF